LSSSIRDNGFGEAKTRPDSFNECRDHVLNFQIVEWDEATHLGQAVYHYYNVVKDYFVVVQTRWKLDNEVNAVGYW
jgi:hypothetical protein